MTQSSVGGPSEPKLVHPQSNYTACPTAIVDAPISCVWKLLITPIAWGDFFDIEIHRVNPPGDAHVGQRVMGATGKWLLRFNIGARFVEIDNAAHTLQLDFQLPFGLTVVEKLSVVRVGQDQCRVTYGCTFVIPKGWRGALLRRMLGRELTDGPEDSLSRLKRAAEETYRSTKDRDAFSAASNPDYRADRV